MAQVLHHQNARVALLSTLCLFSVCVASALGQDFQLRDELGRAWTHECVTFPLTAEQLGKTKSKRPLHDEAGKSVPWQVIAGADGKPRIAFHADLAPHTTASFRFGESGGVNAATDLKVEEDRSTHTIRVSNGKTGIALASKLRGGNGPITGMKLNSGNWVGTSRLETDVPVTDWKVEVTESGPVLVEVVCRITFGEKGHWESRYRLYAGEPVVLVDESFEVDAKASLRLVLSDRFAPTQLFFRHGRGSIGKNEIRKIVPGRVFTMEPWLRWWMADQQGSTFSVFGEKGNDLLTVAAREAGAWVDPDLPRESQAPPHISVTRDDSGLHADFPLRHGRRKWMLGAFDRDASLAVLQDKEQSARSPLPYRYLIKHGHFPLDLVKDYTLRWKSSLAHPRLLMTPQDVVQFRQRVDDKAPYQKSVDYFLQNPEQLSLYRLDEAIPAYLATEDPKMGELLVQTAINLLQDSVDELMEQNRIPYGAAPHMQHKLGAGVGAADIVMGSPHIKAEERDRLRALITFLGYTTARPEYWSTARGFSANPNMTTSVYGYRTRLAAFVSDHPAAKQWIEEGLTELRKQLNTWSDEKGGWLEAPHYAVVSYDEILGMFLVAANAGFNDWLYTEPKIKSVIRWLAKIATPPDSRIGGYRHHPAVGHTYVIEPCGEYGILAYLFREKDPAFSAEMQWMFGQNNRYGAPGIGGFYPAFAGYRRILVNADLPARAPSYSSELFPKTGVILRDHYPSQRETFLHLKHGEHNAHYDDDSGSIILYGKGRILADEFGYIGAAPQDDHSLLESPLVKGGNMSLRDFVTTTRYDYTAGVKGAWTRQIAMVKGATAESPCYFLLNDSLRVAGPATWRLWLTAAEVKLSPNGATVVGKEDVDMDVFFLAPDKVPLKTEPRTRRSGSGMFPNWNWQAMETTQIGLIADLPQTEGLSVLLYPRLKTAKRPTVTVLAGGKAAKIGHEAGVDYLFLGKTAFAYDEGDIHFSGMAGMIQLRDKNKGVVMAMGSAGKISARGKTVASEKALPGTK